MIKRVPVSALRPGMYLHKMGGTWLDHPFWRSAFVLKAADIETLRGTGATEVWIDTDKGVDVQPGAPRATPREAPVSAASTTPSPCVASREPNELERAAALYTQSRKAVTRMFNDVRLGRAIEAEAVMPLVEDISESIRRDAAALVSLVRLKTADQYTYMHSVAVCALMIALSRQLGFNDEQSRRAGLAGLLHDIGKAKIPASIINKPGRLTDQEFAIVRMHPERGHAVLVQGSGIDPVALDVCLRHHEKMDGSGYPGKLKGAQISLLARMGAVCDVYDAVTSKRSYKAPWEPADALRQMAQWQGHFDATVFQAFVKAVGIYPLGSLLRLKSDRLAVVVAQSASSLLLPQVKVFYSAATREPLEPVLLDLSAPNCDDTVQSVEASETWGLGSIDHLWAPAPEVAATA